MLRKTCESSTREQLVRRFKSSAFAILSVSRKNRLWRLTNCENGTLYNGIIYSLGLMKAVFVEGMQSLDIVEATH